MKVRDLIAALVAHDADAEVLTEGCDCWGDTDAVLPVIDPPDNSQFPRAYPGPHVIIVRAERSTSYEGRYPHPDDDEGAA